MSLPQQLPLQQMANTWATALDPVLKNPIVNGSILKSVSLASGANSINHLLGRNLQGWYVTRMRGSAVTIYDTQDSNQTPNLTLTLVSSGAVVIDLAVF